MFRRLTALTLSRYCSLNAMLSCREQSSNITKVWFTPLSKSKFIQPYQMHYIENGRQKRKDMVKVLDSVMAIVYNVSRDKLIYVRQFRPAMYHSIITGNTLEIPKEEVDIIKYPPEMGYSMEPVAGLVDKDKSLVEIAREEVLEEIGYDVPIDGLELALKFRSGVSASSGLITMFYCEVCDAQKVSEGGGVGNEFIEIVELSIDDARRFVQSGTTVNSGPGTIIATLWFLSNKAK